MVARPAPGQDARPSQFEVMIMNASSDETVHALWHAMNLPDAALSRITLTAAEIWRGRTGRTQTVSVNIRDAALECTGFFSIDGRVPKVWDKISGLYRCGAEAGEPGYVRIHANFAHHRDGALKLLGLPP